jgi:hypothetical protein
MASPDSNASAEPPPAAPSPTTGDTPAAAGARPPARLWIWALVAGLAAGSVAAIGGEAAHDRRFEAVLKLPDNWASIGVYDRPDILSNLLRKETPRVEAKNTAIAYGMLGAALGSALGLAGGLARRSTRSGLIAALVGALLGGAIGAIMSVVLIPVFYRMLDPETGMMLGLMVHAGIWVPIGAVSGLALGVGLGSPRAMVLALMGGLAGAALGTMAFEVVNALAFPNARLDMPIPELRSSRILAALCVAILTSLGAELGLQERKRKRKVKAPSELA